MIKLLLALVAMTSTAAAEHRWCKGAHVEHDDAGAETAENSMQDYRGSHHSQYRVVEAARTLCGAPHSAAADKLAAEVLTAWMKETGLDEAHAAESLAVRIDEAAWDAAKEKLCDAMPEEGKLEDAKRRLFGCTGGILWLTPQSDVDVAELVDRGPVSHDDLAHIAWMLHRAAKDLEDNSKRALIGYAVDQIDFRVLPTDAVMHELDAAPYQGNRYAHVVLMESLGVLRLQVARVEAAVQKAAQDPAWKEIVVDSPATAAQQWQHAAAQYKDQLAHFDAPPASGCAKPLRAELAAILKPMDHHSVDGVLDAISDHPLAGYLLSRFVKCVHKEGDQQLAQAIGAVAAAVREKSGPRWAAYYGAVDAIARIGDGAPVKATDLPQLDRNDSGHRHNWDNFGENGVVANVANHTLNFVQKKIQVMDQECHETNKIDRIDANGRVEYRRECRDKGMVWTTDGPRPLKIDDRFADELKPGRYVRMDDRLGSQGAIPVYVFADAKKSRLVAIATFQLQ